MNRSISTLKKHTKKAVFCSAFVLFSASSYGQAWTAVGSPTGVSDGQASDITLLATGVGHGNKDTLYVAYKDYSLSPPGLTVKMWDGTSWTPVGSPNPVASNVLSPKMAIDANGQLAVAYANHINGNRANVKQLLSGTWTAVGSPDFWPATTGGGIDNISFITKGIGTASASEDPFYIGFTDATNSNAATYMHYAGAWTLLGAVQPSASEVTITQNGNTGDVYSIYINTLNTATPIQFQGSNWAPMGTSPSSSGSVFPVIQTNGNVTYAVFSDYGHSRALAVTQYDAVGSTWSSPLVWDTTFLEADYISMVLEGSKTNAIPLVAFQKDPAGTGHASVMHFKGGVWQDVGPTSISIGKATYTSVAINKGGDYFVAFSDASTTPGGRLLVMKLNNPNAVPTVQANNTSIEVYPNPSTGSFTIKGEGQGSYELMNMLGQTIKTFEFTKANSSITISGLNGGIYFVKGMNGFISQKIVVTQ